MESLSTACIKAMIFGQLSEVVSQSKSAANQSHNNEKRQNRAANRTMEASVGDETSGIVLSITDSFHESDTLQRLPTRGRGSIMGPWQAPNRHRTYGDGL